MEEISSLSGHWLELVTAIYLIGMILYGHHKGFIRLAVSATALLITLAAVKYAQPHVIEWIKQDTDIYESMKESIAESIGIDRIIEETGEKNDASVKNEKSLIDELPIPKQMKKLLEENNHVDVYKEIGVQYFRDYVAGYLADLILKAAVFVVLFFAVYLILQVIVIWLDLIAKLPVLSGINKMAGAILGGIQAVIFLWVACLVFTMFSRTGIGKSVLAQISTSAWLSWIYDHNLLSNLFLGLIRIGW